MRVLDILFGPGVGSHDADGLTAPWTDPLVRQAAAALLRCYLVELQHTSRCSADLCLFTLQSSGPCYAGHATNPVCEASGKSMLQHSLAKLQPGLWALSCLLLSASWVLQALVNGSKEHSFCAQEGGLMTE